MKSAKYHEMSVAELEEQEKELKTELFNLRFQHAIGQLGNTGRIGDVKRSIAKVLTVMREKELGLTSSVVRR